MSKVISIVSGKGGVGKTMFSTNMAATFALTGLKVALLDMNVGLRNADIYLGLEEKVIYDVLDVINEVVKIRKALVRDRRFQALYLLAGTYNAMLGDEHFQKLHSVVKYLKENFDIVIIDGPAGLNATLDFITKISDINIIVTTSEYVSLRDADVVNHHINENIGSNYRHIDKVFCVINKMNAETMKKCMLPGVEKIISMMRMPLLGVIRYDDDVHLNVNSGIPAVLEMSYLKKNFNKMMLRVMGHTQ